MIYCPVCGAKTQTLETRAAHGYTRRRRGCTTLSCNQRITTFEIAVDDPKDMGEPILVSRAQLEAALGALGVAFSRTFGTTELARVLEPAMAVSPSRYRRTYDESDE